VLEAVQGEFVRQHGTVAGGRLALVAMGKLGSGEMTAASDIDLILLYDHAEDAGSSDGARALAPSHYYARLTQRLVTALSAPTGQGRLYEVDFRLRPSGNAGPLATRLDAFARYQAEDAWTWEHMALTRARVLAATGGLEGEVNAAIAAILERPRDPAAVCRDAADMRARIAEDKPTRDPWAIKTVAGGLIDLEFIAQVLRLVHQRSHADLDRRDTGGILAAAGGVGLLSADEKEGLTGAFRLYQDLTQMTRLLVEGPYRPDPAQKGTDGLVCRATGQPSIGALQELLEVTQARVRTVFEARIGPVVRRP